MHNNMTQSIQIRFFILEDREILSLQQIPYEKEREIEKITISIKPIFNIFHHLNVSPYQQAVKLPLEKV